MQHGQRNAHALLPTASQPPFTPTPIAHLAAPALASVPDMHAGVSMEQAPPSGADEGADASSDDGGDVHFNGLAPDLALGDGDEVVAAQAAADAIDIAAEVGAADVAIGADMLEEIAAPPRKGSGAWLHARRLEPIAEGSTQSVLQSAFSIAEMRGLGVSNEACNLACQNMCQVLDSFAAHKGKHTHPQSLHMVKAVLGVEDAAKYEFGWCSGCGERFDAHQRHAPDASIEDTCLRCGKAKYKVRDPTGPLTFEHLFRDLTP